MRRSIPGAMALLLLGLSLVGCGGGGDGEGAADGTPVRGSPRIEAPVYVDPALETPQDPVWHEFWLPVVNPQREGNPSVALVDEFVSPRPGMVIGDIGAGGGFFSFRYARIVGETGMIHAVDIDRRMTRKISYEATSRGVDNVRSIHVALGDLGLAPGSVDVVMFNDIGAFTTCHPDLNPGYFRQAAEALRPGGRMIVLNTTFTVQRPGEQACRTLSAEEVIDLSRERFTVVSQRELEKGADWTAFAVLFQRLP